MDEASRIVADLQQKLNELDYKVVQYRHEMCSEFEKYTEQLLRNVTQDVSAQVTKTIAASLKNYPTLHPEPKTATTPNENITDEPNKDEPHCVPNSSSSAHDEPPRSPHEREREFTGLFTPSYLPLLDSTDRHERRSSQDMIKVPPLKAEISQDSNSPVKQMVTTGGAANPATPTLLLQRPPTPLRKNTDTSSVLSNGSDSESRKSALRRSSSSASPLNILSPRKVRFALEGGEYPTDSSPRPPLIEEESPKPKRNPIILGYYNNDNDSDDEAGSQQVENIEDPPPPKRISSSQALRALSRGPLEEDDGTKWTQVVAPPDGSASVPVGEELKDGRAYIDADDDDIETFDMKEEAPRFASPFESQNSQKTPQASVDESSQRDISPKETNENLTPESRPTNSNPTQAKGPSQTNGMSTTQAQAVPGSVPNPAVTASPALRKSRSTFSLGESDSESESETEQVRKGEDEDDGLFDFEEGTEIHNKKENAKTNPDISRFSPSDILSSRMGSYKQADVTSPGMSSSYRPGSLGKQTQTTGFSSSYGGSGSYQQRKSSSDNSQTVGTPSGINYSYKGTKNNPHPFSQPIASERGQREAEQMGDLKSWVGSVDGRSGVDPSQDSGFRGSSVVKGGGSVREGGHPRSFSERLMMEEEMEEARGSR